MNLLLMGGPRRVAYDSFTDVDGTSLAAHKLDTGQSWSLTGTGTLTIQGNACQSNASAAVEIAWVQTYEKAVKAEFDGQLNSSDIALWTRADGGASGAENGWAIDIVTTGVTLFECVAGSFTSRASASFAVSTGVYHHWTMTDTGTSFAISFDGSLKITYASNTRYGTFTGIEKGGAVGAVANLFDNFQVSTLL